ncbi:hypothetical protein SEVIR_7G244600v4 [Setaria viridis]|uniref:PCI domain-containing protein n=1 Tax=Setaria viridis TaxID=4556 RepID=A0A4U6TW59_SETVI|nr:26S proteasome non-ATPase regulatory subunit 8 homolog A-like [Setaria viridis]TKW06502.1 hypothetical protein SEVIR_7G244600v2 [Setaria viridis]
MKRDAASQSMDSELGEATCKLAWLNFACARGDIDSCVALLSELKVLLTRLPSLPPSFEKTPNAVKELKIARAIYENAVILSLKIKDRGALERSLCQLKEFYISTCGIIAPSPNEYPFLGLNLLRLLAENRIAEFHTELELLPLEALNHPCIKYATELEQSFMEGAYNRFFNARQAVPHETYVYLMDLLAETVRDEVAECSVDAYDYLPISVAKKMLMFRSDQELLEYISEEQPEWEIKDCSVHFDMAKPKSHMNLPSFKLFKQALRYARELEHIV